MKSHLNLPSTDYPLLVLFLSGIGAPPASPCQGAIHAHRITDWLNIPWPPLFWSLSTTMLLDLRCWGVNWICVQLQAENRGYQQAIDKVYKLLATVAHLSQSNIVHAAIGVTAPSLCCLVFYGCDESCRWQSSPKQRCSSLLRFSALISYLKHIQIRIAFKDTARWLETGFPLDLCAHCFPPNKHLFLY